jgi:AcrR family transcriptional regulator
MTQAPSSPGRYGRRRPRPGLTPATVVGAGRRVIERDGLDALTMRAVAAELNTAATSLYRHIADREALLVAILEQIAEGLPVDVPGDGPRARIVERLVRTHDYMADHIWVLHILIRGELVAETAFRSADAFVADFVAAGLSAPRALRAYRTCWHLTVGELLSEHPLDPPRHASQRRRAVAGIDPERLPALARALRETDPRPGDHDSWPEAAGRLVTALLAAPVDDSSPARRRR